MSFVYTPAKVALATKLIDLSSDDIFALLVMSNSTADSDVDAELVADFGTLDECNGAGYARQAMTPGQAVTADLVNHLAVYAADNIEWEDLGAGARQIKGLVIYKGTINSADDGTSNELLAYVDTGGFPFTANGSDVIVEWNAAGILQVA
jgi:hypothetical protein